MQNHIRAWIYCSAPLWMTSETDPVSHNPNLTSCHELQKMRLGLQKYSLIPLFIKSTISWSNWELCQLRLTFNPVYTQFTSYVIKFVTIIYKYFIHPTQLKKVRQVSVLSNSWKVSLPLNGNRVTTPY